MRIRTIGLISILVLGLLPGLLAAEAQLTTKVPRIGYLAGRSLFAFPGRLEPFRQGLHELGYVEGENIVIEYRWAEGKFQQLPRLAAELVRSKVDVIVTAGSAATRAAKKATTTIPIVMAQDPDPVRNGFVASLARPGGNITGLSRLAPELSGKQLELLKEIVPDLSRVAIFGTSARPGNRPAVREVELAAAAFGFRVQYLDILGPKDIEPAFQAANKERADAVVMMVAGFVATPNKERIAELAVQSGLPTVYFRREDVEAGGLMSYGVNMAALDRRAAAYVDKILKGANPADLPIEQPTTFELVVNLKTAKELGITIPPSMLYRADKVIR